MKPLTHFVLVAFCTMPALAKNQVSITLTAENIASLKPTEDLTREAFADKWGQFEIRIPKAQFPIAAPNCRKEVILRSAGVDPASANSKERLESRWAIYQSLRKLVREKTGSVDLPIAAGPYMQKDKAGAPVLEYCNAYISANG